MSDTIDSYGDPCEECMHRLRKYCKAWQSNLEILDVNNCKRRKKRK